MAGPLEAYRMGRGLSRKDLALASGCSEVAIGGVERGECGFPEKLVAALLGVLDHEVVVEMQRVHSEYMSDVREAAVRKLRGGGDAQG